MEKIKIGKKYNRWTIIKEVKPHIQPNGRKKRKVLCLCDCGAVKSVLLSNLIRNKTRSCGCLRKEVVKKIFTTHGKKNTSTYRSWESMKRRCLNENYEAYKNYGGRGIKVCKRWLKFENFYKDMGEKPKGETLDRINNNEGYAPNNCRWASWKTQQNNRRNNRLITFNGKTQTIAQWSRGLGIKGGTIRTRLSRGWSVKKCFKK